MQNYNHLSSSRPTDFYLVRRSIFHPDIAPRYRNYTGPLQSYSRDNKSPVRCATGHLIPFRGVRLIHVELRAAYYRFANPPDSVRACTKRESYRDRLALREPKHDRCNRKANCTLAGRVSTLQLLISIALIIQRARNARDVIVCKNLEIEFDYIFISFKVR